MLLLKLFKLKPNKKEVKFKMKSAEVLELSKTKEGARELLSNPKYALRYL